MTAKPRQQEASAEELRLALAYLLVRMERRRQRATAIAFCETFGTSVSTLSKIENNHYVDLDTLSDIGIALGWGFFLHHVIAGKYDDAKESGDVDGEIRRMALSRLREISSQEGNG